MRLSQETETICDKIFEHNDESKGYVFIGRSPLPLYLTCKLKKNVFSLAASRLHNEIDLSTIDLQYLKSHLEPILKYEKVYLVDYVETGKSLSKMYEIIRYFIEINKSNCSVEIIALYFFKKPLLKNFESAIWLNLKPYRAYTKLLIGHKLKQVFSEYTYIFGKKTQTPQITQESLKEWKKELETK